MADGSDAPEGAAVEVDEKLAFQFARSRGLVSRLRFEKRSLPVKLTDGEIARYAREMSDYEIEEGVIEAEMKAAAKNYKDQLGGIASEIRTRARIISSGQESRQIPVVEGIDEAGNHLVSYRLDTMAEVSRRPLTMSERQLELDDAQRRAEEPPEAEGGDAEAAASNDEAKADEKPKGKGRVKRADKPKESYGLRKGDGAVDRAHLESLDDDALLGVAKRLGWRPAKGKKKGEIDRAALVDWIEQKAAE